LQDRRPRRRRHGRRSQTAAPPVDKHPRSRLRESLIFMVPRTGRFPSHGARRSTVSPAGAGTRNTAGRDRR
jgi:hypothetical protein